MTPQDGQSPGRRGRSGECRTKSPWSGRSVADQGPCTHAHQPTVEGGLTAISYAKTARPKPRRKLRRIITRLS